MAGLQLSGGVALTECRVHFRHMKNSFVGYKLFTLSAREFVRDDCFTLSLSISFVFLLSIIPFVTLSVLIFKSIQDAFSPKLIGPAN